MSKDNPGNDIDFGCGCALIIIALGLAFGIMRTAGSIANLLDRLP